MTKMTFKKNYNNFPISRDQEKDDHKDSRILTVILHSAVLQLLL